MIDGSNGRWHVVPNTVTTYQACWASWTGTSEHIFMCPADLLGTQSRGSLVAVGTGFPERRVGIEVNPKYLTHVPRQL